jgi:Tfp pilus assembly protein FimV
VALSPPEVGRGPQAAVYRFPTAELRRRAGSRARVARRRRTVAVAACLCVAGASLWARGSPAAPPALTRPGAPASILVRPGDTVWDVAGRSARAGVDTRAYVDAVVRLNEIRGPLPAGTRLRLPR